MIDPTLEPEIRHFSRSFGVAPEWAARAPGRINLIGEHTDHQEGLVFPAAIRLGITVVGARRPDSEIHVRSRALGAEALFHVDDLVRRNDWVDYVKGVMAEFRELHRAIPGFNAIIGGDLPPGSGMSSSSALGSGIALLLERMCGTLRSPEERAALVHRAETRFVGVPAGIMDPYASNLGMNGHALRIDCRSKQVEARPVSTNIGTWITIDCGAPHNLRDSGYSTRRGECEEAVEILRRSNPDVRTLRDLSSGDLASARSSLPLTLYRRARHVVTENERVRRFSNALKDEDRTEIGALLVQSHESLRDDFEVSTPELDHLMRIALEEGALGARLMGGGFGGSTLNLVRTGDKDWPSRVVETYQEQTGREATAYVHQLSEGAIAHDLRGYG